MEISRAGYGRFYSTFLGDSISSSVTTSAQKSRVLKRIKLVSRYIKENATFLLFSTDRNLFQTKAWKGVIPDYSASDTIVQAINQSNFTWDVALKGFLTSIIFTRNRRGDWYQSSLFQLQWRFSSVETPDHRLTYISYFKLLW